MKKIIFDNKNTPFDQLTNVSSFDWNVFKDSMYEMIDEFDKIQKEGTDIYVRNLMYNDAKRQVGTSEQKIYLENTHNKKFIKLEENLFKQDGNEINIMRVNSDFSNKTVSVFSTNNLNDNVFRIKATYLNDTKGYSISMTKNNNYKAVNLIIKENEYQIYNDDGVVNPTKRNSNFIKFNSHRNIELISKTIVNNKDNYHIKLKNCQINYLQIIDNEITDFKLKKHVYTMLKNNFNKDDINTLKEKIENSTVVPLIELIEITEKLNEVKELDLLIKDKTTTKSIDILSLLNECNTLIKNNEDNFFTIKENDFNNMYNFLNSVFNKSETKQIDHPKYKLKEVDFVNSDEDKELSLLNTQNISNMWNVLYQNAYVIKQVKKIAHKI